MQITRTQAVAIFTAIGFQTADRWDIARFNTKLAKIGDNVTDERLAAIADKGVRELATNVVKTARKDQVECVEDPPVAAPKGKGKKASPTPAPAAAPAGKGKGKAAPKAEDKFDKFHNRLNSGGHKVNEVLWNAKKVLTVEEIAKASGLSAARVRSHVRWLVDVRKLATESDKGFKVK
jgi:hypothetical protein